MTAATPEHLRNLADYCEGPDFRADTDEAVTAALRTAADRLEAVQELAADALTASERSIPTGAVMLALTADTAPQEPGPSRRVLITHPHDGHGPNDTCRDCEASDD